MKKKVKLVCSVFVLFLQWLSLVHFICAVWKTGREMTAFWLLSNHGDDENCAIHFYHDFSYNCFANISEKSVHCSSDIWLATDTQSETGIGESETAIFAFPACSATSGGGSADWQDGGQTRLHLATDLWKWGMLLQVKLFCMVLWFE